MHFDSRFAAWVAYSRRLPHAILKEHADGQSRMGRNMLKSQGIEAFPDSVPPFRVFICACRRPLVNTLKFYTQKGVPPVPCAHHAHAPDGD
jgi:hypothetical protein